MKRFSLLIAFFFLLVSCKDSAPLNSVKVVTPIENGGGSNEQSLDLILTKKTTLISRVVSFSETEIATGVKEIRIDYINKNAEPMVLFFFRVDLNNKNIALKPITPNGQKAYAMQTIPDMVQTNSFAGYNIIGAVNSDFFNTSTGEPRSILFLNKVAVRTTLPEIRSYLAFTDAGIPIIGDHSVFASQRNTIVDAVGGYHRLIKQSLVLSQSDDSIHPRTAVGFTSNKILYFLVADGRNANYSNGLTLAQVAEIMQAFEVKEAINLDGGGSSTFVSNKNGTIVKNKPSDGSPRKVANGWAICIKK